MSNTLVLDRIESNLTRLRLPRTREILESVLKSAEKHDKSHLSFMDELLEEEVAAKVQRRIETALKISGLPYMYGRPPVLRYISKSKSGISENVSGNRFASHARPARRFAEPLFSVLALLPVNRNTRFFL